MSALPARFWVKVNKTDGCWLWTASLTTGGYGQFRHDGKVCRAHRLAYEALVGPIPDGLMLDHTCFNKACVKPDHLRLTTCKQNQEHRQGAAVTNLSTGVRGVHVWRKSGRYYSKLRHDGRQIYIGTFDTIEEAAAAWQAKADELFTHHSRAA